MVLAIMPVNVAQVYAEDTTITNQGVVYTFDDKNKTASVTGFTDDLLSEVVIPSTVQKSETDTEYEVTSIGNNVFQNCKILTSVTITASVTKIGDAAFAECTSLTSIHFTGTSGKWENIAKDENWASDPAPAIHFISGDTKKTQATLQEDGCIIYECQEDGCSEKERIYGVIRKPESFKLSEDSFTYDGAAKTPDITVTDSVGTVIDPSNYDVTYDNNTNAGTATIKVTFKGDDYDGVKDLNFEIKGMAIKPSVALSPASYTYDGKIKTPKITVKDGGTVLKK